MRLRAALTTVVLTALLPVGSAVPAVAAPDRGFS